MKNAFFYQFILNTARNSNVLRLPRFLKDLVKDAEINDFSELDTFFNEEIQNTSLQDQQETDYFLFLIHQALMYSFYKRDLNSFEETLEIAKYRLNIVRNLDNVEDFLPAWEKFLELLTICFQRQIRHTSLENFEYHIDNLDWSSLDKSFIAQISSLIGYIYLLEDDAEQVSKSRIWMQKAIFESEAHGNLINYLFSAQYHLNSEADDKETAISSIIESIGSIESESEAEKKVLEAAKFELEIQNIPYNKADENGQSHNELILAHLKTAKRSLKDLSQNNRIPRFAIPHAQFFVASLTAKSYLLTNSESEKEDRANEATQTIDDAINSLNELNDEYGVFFLRCCRAEIFTTVESNHTEKEIKEVIQFYKKASDYPSYMRATKAYLNLLSFNDTAQKSYDVIKAIFKYGGKSMEEGGFYLITNGFEVANEVFIKETEKPRISWMVDVLDKFFENIKTNMDLLDQHYESFGNSLVESFRKEYLKFEAVSHFNIKVYLAFQLYLIKLNRVGAIIHGDEVSLNACDMLLRCLADKNNPLEFISSQWTDFKLVPNDVRNKTLNKSITITKGDLPYAADHLDFSYRNLRSYITFKEVNRLGNFLDLQETSNKQLEQGIRLMFYDLYKKGTIFEVVFDMPKFLVEHASSGFFSQDMEDSLNIKGTTAKKYIKIMIENHLIRQDKASGRKHFYRLEKENVMNRLGKDQNILIS